MSVFRDLTYLEHILESIEKIQLYTKGIDEDSFNDNSLIQDGVIRQFEIIGEASKRISKNLKEEFPLIPWKDMAGMRDVLIHDYINVELDTIWKTVKEYLPPLKSQIVDIINKKSN